MIEVNPRCPVCGHFMSYYLLYAYGQGQSGYRCHCGYDSAQQKIVYSTISQSEEWAKNKRDYPL